MFIKITKEILRFPLPFNSGEVNSYLFKGDRGFTVVDTGFRSDETIQLWKKFIADGLVIEKVVLTHGHPDHMGLASWFQQEICVPVIHSRIGYKAMKELRGSDRQPYRFNQIHDGPLIPEKMFYEQMSAYDFEPDDVYDEGQGLTIGNRCYETIWTPGHSLDHFCFWDQDEMTMIVGDHVLGDISPVISLWSEDGGNPLHDYFNSLKRLEQYQVGLVLPGHGKPIADLKKRIDEIRDGHLFRMRQMLDMLGKGGKTAGEVRRELYGDRGSFAQTVMEFSSTLARLRYLEAAGQILSRVHDEKTYFFKSAR